MGPNLVDGLGLFDGGLTGQKRLLFYRCDMMIPKCVNRVTGIIFDGTLEFIYNDVEGIENFFHQRIDIG